jgi:phosphatidylglycerophosphatase A
MGLGCVHRRQSLAGAAGWGLTILAGLLVGLWACTRTAQHLGVADPSAIVWDEIVAFWVVLWLLTPASAWLQALAFALFRFFDAAKPGPVGWADRRFKLAPGEAIGWRQGVGILVDDLVAAACTLFVLAAGLAAWRA